MSNLSIALKEISRIKRMVKRIEQRGFEVNLPAKYSGLKKTGEQKTRYSRKDIEQLKSFKAKNVYKYSTYKLPTGKTVKGIVGREYERSMAAKKAAITRQQMSEGLKPYKTEHLNMDRKEKAKMISRSIINNAIISEFLKLGLEADNLQDADLKNFIEKLRAEGVSDSDIADGLQRAKSDGEFAELEKLIKSKGKKEEKILMLDDMATQYFGVEFNKIEDKGIDEVTDVYDESMYE